MMRISSPVSHVGFQTSTSTKRLEHSQRDLARGVGEVQNRPAQFPPGSIRPTISSICTRLDSHIGHEIRRVLVGRRLAGRSFRAQTRLRNGRPLSLLRHPGGVRLRTSSNSSSRGVRAWVQLRRVPESRHEHAKERVD